MQQGFWTEFRACFHGSGSWTAWLVMVYLIALTPALFWLAIRLFRAESTREQILFATGVIVVVVWIGFLKLWFWMRSNRLVLEAQLNRLAERPR